MLTALEKVLDEHSGLDTTPKGLTEKSRNIWKRIKWDSEEIQGFRSRINANIGLLNAFRIGLIE